MSADDSVFMTSCPLVGSQRVAVAHRDTIVVTTTTNSKGTSTMTIPIDHSVRALGFVPFPESAVNSSPLPAGKSPIKEVIVSGTSAADVAAKASAYIVTGGDDKSLALIRVNSADGTATIVDTHGPVGKKVSHLIVIPTVSAAAETPFAALVAKAPTGIAPYCPIPTGTFATTFAPSVALTTESNDKDDEENDDNNVKVSGLSATDGYAVAAGRYYPNQVANVVFGNKFGEVYVIALLKDAATNNLVFGPAPVFLLQHFSVLSSIALFGDKKGTNLQNSDTARIVTCDRDGHARVSRYPATFEIEQFLWGPYTAPKEGEERQKQQAPVATVVGADDAKVLFTGDVSGRVNHWVAYESTSDGQQQQWKLQNIFDFEEEEASASTQPINYGGVVGLAFLEKKGTASSSSPSTLLVARDHVKSLFAVRFESGAGNMTVEAATTSAALPTDSTIVQLCAAESADGTTTAVALFRNGSIYSISEELAFTLLYSPTAATEGGSTTAPASWVNSLKSVDLYYAWKSQFAENKQKRDEERAMADERNKVNPKTNENSKSKKKGGARQEE